MGRLRRFFKARSTAPKPIKGKVLAVQLMTESASELGGYKEVVIRIDGDNVFGTLRFESGGHRVQRVPTTETQGRICLLYTSPSPRDLSTSRMPSSA